MLAGGLHGAVGLKWAEAVIVLTWKWLEAEEENHAALAGAENGQVWQSLQGD